MSELETSLVEPRDPVRRQPVALYAPQRQFRACYEAQLKAHPKLAGKFVFAFTIAADGSVPKASAVKSSEIPALDECMVRQLKSLKFPTSSQDVRITYPFVFQTE